MNTHTDKGPAATFPFTTAEMVHARYIRTHTRPRPGEYTRPPEYETDKEVIRGLLRGSRNIDAAAALKRTLEMLVLCDD